ncbi:MAG: chromosome segregation protein SMC [Deltaproteobacteria bacterium]|nr:chromosome segregation protein SMC [Deltaproteobacteria bacterium]
MKVKELTIQGFKSFVHRTRIPLHPGITVVVGPNGCGKSNILDALRWVMGEQRPLQLRGKNMADVIFNGTHTLKPAGMAEVSLTMVADNGGRLPEPYDQYSELMITRRMYRHGESEYFLGRVPCRLKDITALFRDTGIGAKGYAFIEQGRVSQIITARPTEIREMFEEAAGISGFQVQRQESYRKIRESEVNLERLDDIIREVSRNLRHLRKQARQAEKFSRLQDEERQLDQRLTGWRHRRLTAELAPLRAAVESRKEELADRESRRQRLGAELADLQAALEKLQRQIDDYRQRLNQGRETLITTNSNIALRRQELAGLQQQLQAAENRARGSRRRLEEVERSLAGLEEELAAATGRWQAQEEARQALEADYERAKQAAAEEAGREDRLRQELFVLLRQETDCHNEELLNREKRQRLEQRRQELQSRHRRDQEACQALEKEMDEAEQALDEIRRQRQQAAAANQRLRELLAREQDCRRQLEEQRQEVLGRFTVLDREWHRLQTKVAEGFGFSEGMKQALQEEAAAIPIGSFWDVFAEVPTEWEAALELFIRQLCEGVVIADQQAVDEFIDRQRRRPRVAALHPRKTPLLIDGQPLSAAEIPCLADLVRVKEKFRQVVEPVLRQTFVAEDGDTARRLLPELPANSYVLTIDGEIYAGNGWFWVGRPQEQEQLDLLSLRRQRDEAAAERQRLGRELAAVEETLAESDGRLAALRQEEEASRQRLTTAQEEERRRERLVGELRQRLAAARERQQQGEEEARRLAAQEAELAAGTAALDDRLAAIATAKSEQEKQLAALADRHRAAREQLLALQEQLTEKKVALAAVAAEKSRLERERQQLAAEKERLQRQQVSLGREIEGNRRQQAAIEAGIGEQEAEVGRLEVECRVLEEKLTACLREKEQLAATQQQRQEDARRLDQELAARRPELLEKQLALQELENGVRQLENGFSQRYGTSLAAYLASDDRPEPETPLDEEEAAARLEEIRRQLAEFGQVNLLALEEMTEVQQRHDFLKEQKADLLASIRTVRDAIEKMETSSREKFLATFFQVNDHFSQLFSELFGGGRVSLRLTDEENIWEAGIDIAAAPPGKRLQNLRLFSGGEKALIAIALIFAFFRVNPAPFCVLDEVDAPLDDANIIRFNQLVRKFAADSQFLLITHNQKTMTIGDYLYGVTMEESGVSKAVAVELTDYRFRDQPRRAALAE